MRVRLTGDSGAAAIILVFMTVVFLGLAALAVDAGTGFVNKRNLQNAADAAVLAGADSLATERRDCTQVKNDMSKVAAVHTLASDYAADNRPDNQETGFAVRCSTDNKRIEVWYRDAGNTTTIFASMFGDSSGTTAEREAVASVGVPGSVTGLRPYFVCLSDADALRASSGWLQIAFPNAGCGSPPGNWYSVDCPEDGQGNSTPVLATNTWEGCQSEINIVDVSSAGGNPAAEQALLIAACNGSPALSADRGCLTGNTGNLASNPIETQWQKLLGETIALPVFDPATVQGTGNGARYPVKAILAAKVCGYKWNSKSGISSDSECAGVTMPGGNNNFLWLKFGSYQTSGSSSPSNCALGDTSCDYGLRRVALEQ